MDTEFAILRAGEDVYSVTNSSGHTFYIVEGDERAAVIDTGCTHGRQIMPIIRRCTQKPVLLIITHAHSDHIYHMDEFDEVYMSHREFELPESFLQMMMEDKQLDLRSTRDVHTGDIIDLGGTALEVLETPGHTPGSIVLWERRGNHLFTGDAIGSGNDVWMQWPSALPLDQYYPTLVKLLHWAVERGGRMKLLGGHARQCFGSHLLSYNPLSLGWLCDLIDLVDQVLQGKIVGIPSDADIILEEEPPMCAGYGRALMQYMPSRIHTPKNRRRMPVFPLPSSLLIQGNSSCAYRDPAVIFHEGVFHLYFTYVDNSEGGPWLYLAECTSSDLLTWSEMRLLTPKDKSLNYSSPGNVIRDGDDFVICFQTYCRENGEKYGNENSRLFTMRSKDLVTWTEPELLRVKGPDVPRENMGRMIDPYLLRAGDEWWCFFKQNGVSFSKSKDLQNWTFVGSASAGENACVVPCKNGYRLFTSPKNGISVMDSTDLINWHKVMPDLMLGQDEWDWAKGRITAGFVMENTKIKTLPRYLMFFHASRYTEEVEFDSNASIGIAFSDDLEHWNWA